MLTRMRRFLIGAPRDIHDPQLFHKVSLIAFMAWVGLGADGLSSSAYGPEEAFKAIGGHRELVIPMFLAMTLTVFVISYAYSRIIEQFPAGGGGYGVATKLLGAPFGVVSGCALLVDYVLTISVSISAGADQLWSFLPLEWVRFKLPFEAAAIGGLIVMNLRGVKESVNVLIPIFLFFVVSHLGLLAGAFAVHAGRIPEIASHATSGLHGGLATVGFLGLFKIFAWAYAQGAGTYTGIEAVSNGVQIMREPKVPTARRTMIYMAVSLALTAGGILLAYEVVGVRPQEGRTLNAVLADSVGLGPWFMVSICIAEAALLCIAAQTGFLDGPRVMANMAHDSWLPHRFSALSDRLTIHHGIQLIGAAALATLFFTNGSTEQLVTMYSINVFVTFSLTELGMCRFWISERRRHPDWRRHLPVHAVGLLLCSSILVLQVVEKFQAGGKETALITAGLILLCFVIRAYYRRVQRRLSSVSAEALAAAVPASERSVAVNPAQLDRSAPTAVVLVNGYNGPGVHALLTIARMFPRYYPQAIFVSVGVLDSANFKGGHEVAQLEERTRAGLEPFAALANRMGLAASTRVSVGTDAVDESEKLCTELSREFPRATFFSGKVVFPRARWYHRVLHNQTSYAIQRRLEWAGLPMIILPLRLQEA